MKVDPRPWLGTGPLYVPGAKAVDELGSPDSNESPLGASPADALAVARALDHLHRYPDPLAEELCDAIAADHCASPDQVIVGNGSDELICLLAWAFAAHGGRVVCADPAHRMNEITSMVSGAAVTHVPLLDWGHDLDEMARVDADIAYVVNPHNPTGTTHTLADITRFARECKADVVVVDEAYLDFTEDPGASTAASLAVAGEVLVLRTFSKVHGLGGMRVGYLLGNESIIATLRRMQAPFSVGYLAQVAGLTALADRSHRDRVRSRTVEFRRRLVKTLEDAGLTAVPSQANFVLVPTDDEEGLVELLARCGVAVRPGTSLGVPGAVRIGVPSREGLWRIEQALSAV